jgi:hypothetical protein
MASTKSLSLWEWVIYLGVVAATIAVTEALGIDQKWENACVYTVLVFVGAIIAVGSVWRRNRFWWRLVGLFALHVLVITLVTQSLPVLSEGIHGIPMMLSGCVEVLVVAGILWKGSRQRDRDAA